MIPKNKRNNHNEVQEMSNEFKSIYKNRIVIEHFFGKFKQYKSFLVRFVRKAMHFASLIDFTNCCIISNAL